MHIVVVNSWGKDKRPEWSRRVKGKTYASAMKKAWAIVADCGAERSDCEIWRGEVVTHLNVY